MTRWVLGLSDPNILGAVAAVAVCSLVGVAVAVRSPGRIWSWVWALGCSASAIVLVASLSRGAWLATAVVCLLCVLWPGRLARRWLGMAALLALALLIAAWPRALERVGDLAQGGQESGNRTRMALWRAGCAVVADHPGTGVPTLGVRAAIESLEPIPEHLRASNRWPLDNVCNDLLQRGMLGGLPALLPWLLGFSLAVAVGWSALRAGSPWGLALVCGSLACVMAGQWSCVWTEDRIATALLAGLLLAPAVVALVALWGRWRLLAQAGGWALLAASVLSLATWGACAGVSRWAGTPRLVADGAGGWALAPRGPSQGTLVWFPAAGETTTEIRREVLLPAARRGWHAAIAAPAGPPPIIAIAREEAVAEALRQPAQARILLDGPPTLLEAVAASSQPVLCVYGQPDPRGWMRSAEERLGAGRVRAAPLGRLWSTRFTRLLPDLEPWMNQPTNGK